MKFPYFVHNTFGLLICLLFVNYQSIAQEVKADIPRIESDTTETFMYDTLESGVVLDSTLTNYLRENSSAQDIKKDSIPKEVVRSAIEQTITYNAKDSIITELIEQKVYLYGEAVVTYGDITLKANYIELDLEKEEVYAQGVPDSTGNMTGEPNFTEKQETFDADVIRYNFKTKKGYIKGIITEQEGGYMHSEATKRLPTEEIHIHNGKYTTCDLEHPHFYISMGKAKVIPGEKIVTGPAFLVIEDLKLPLFLPFGIFPNRKGRSSGIIIPAYGEERTRGFFIRHGGYYLGLNDFFDFKITGDIYSKGSYGYTAESNYKLRYKFSGNFQYIKNKNVVSEEGLSDYFVTNSYWIKWRHSQDPKANPSQSFNASVSFGSSEHQKYNSQNTADYLQSTTQSSVSYSKRWEGTPFNLSANLNHSQNNKTNEVNMNLPKVSFNMSRIYPLKKALGRNAPDWLKDIEVSYSSNFDNQLKAQDSTLFSQETFDNARTGYKHSIPLRTNIKMLNNLFTISPSVNYEGFLLPHQVEKYYDFANFNEQTGKYSAVEVTDTVAGWRYSHVYFPRLSASFNPKLYGTFQMKNPDLTLKAIRHVITPSVGFSYVPDMTGIVPNYEREYSYINSSGDTITKEYNIFANNIYSLPTISERSGGLTFALRNNIEMKVRDNNDTTGTGTKKIKLLDNLNISTSYNLFADSLNWQDLSLNGNTSIGRFLRFNFTGGASLYALDTLNNNRKFNTFEYDYRNRWVRPTKMNFSLDLTLNSKTLAGEKSKEEETEEDTDYYGDVIDQHDILNQYVDFDIPWNLSIRYSHNISMPNYNREDWQTRQTLNFSGDFSLTPQWKIGFSSGWDFVNNELSHTNINIHRDLHCWEARFTWIPIGLRQSYQVQINVKSSMLQDLKWQKKRSWYDSLQEN